MIVLEHVPGGETKQMGLANVQDTYRKTWWNIEVIKKIILNYSCDTSVGT